MTPRLPTYDLLICTIPHRHETLCELLSDLGRQIRALEDSGVAGYVGAVLYRDNLTTGYGEKTQALLEASTADYVSCIDDDDLLARDGIDRIYGALLSWPDYVGFDVAWTRDGEPQRPVRHSLSCPRWSNGGDRLERSVMQFNPIRRDIALDGKWEGGYEAEIGWGDGVIKAGRLRREAFIGGPPVYLYRERTTDTFKTYRAPFPRHRIPVLPYYPWLRILKTEHSA